MAQATLTRDQFIVEPGKQDIVIKTVFDAPRDRVYHAYTDRHLVPKYWGPASLTTKVDRMDVKRGGGWRFIQKDPQGKEFIFRGVYHDVVPSERLTLTFEWEEMPGHVILEKVTFKDLEGKTEVTDQMVFQSVEDRDGMYKMGMEQGTRESHERFAKLVEKP